MRSSSFADPHGHRNPSRDPLHRRDFTTNTAFIGTQDKNITVNFDLLNLKKEFGYQDKHFPVGTTISGNGADFYTADGLWFWSC